MTFLLIAGSLAALLFVAMVALGALGRRIALRRASVDPEGAWRGIGVVDAAVLGVLGLIVALTFNGAVSRFDVRRTLVVEEANAVAAVRRHLDLLPGHSQEALRADLRDYLDARIAAYQRFPDVAAVQAELDRAKHIEDELWTKARAAIRDSPPSLALLVPALNRMSDIGARQTAAILVHPPFVVFAVLAGIAMVAALLAGYAMASTKSRDRVRTLSFAAVTAIAFYVILDIEFPRLGFFRIDSMDRVLVELRATMN